MCEELGEVTTKLNFRLDRSTHSILPQGSSERNQREVDVLEIDMTTEATDTNYCEVRFDEELTSTLS